MKLNDGFLHSMHQAMALLGTQDSAGATEVVQRALREMTIGKGSPIVPQQHPQRTLMRAALQHTQTQSKQVLAPVMRETVIDIARPGDFGTHFYANAAGRRQYRLYEPASADGGPLPLIVMLHGCTQDADDFAAGTQMNVLAERYRCLVAYPVQPRQANPSKCWNWFKPGDQHREQGEPSLIAGITREIIAAHHVDPTRVYIAGMSAGGAMAAVMIAAYPEVYAAAGVHSGLPTGCAHDLPSALAAMKGGRRFVMKDEAEVSPNRPLIVFHGDADTTVHISNATRLVHGFDAQSSLLNEALGTVVGRRARTVKRMVSADGVDAELWTIHGAPHAWAGGHASGSYTDPAGPDASAEMLRFFLDHPKR